MPSSFWYRLLLVGVVCAVFWSSTSLAQSDVNALQALLAKADSASPALAEVRAQLATARAAYTSARALPNPSLFVNSEEIDGSAGSIQERTLGVRQNLGFLWAQSSRWSSAKSAYEAAQANYEERHRELHAKIIYAAVRYAQLKEQRSFLDSLTVISDQLVEASDARAKVGDISQYDAERMRLEQIETNSRQATVTQDEQTELILLVELTGLPAEEFSISVPVPSVPFTDEASALSYAREHRPRWRELDNAARAAKQSVTAARLGVLPDLNFGIGQKTVDPEADGLYWEADLEIPIFGQRRSALQQARAEKAAADLRVVSGQRTAEQEVISAFQRWQEGQRWNMTNENQAVRAQRNLQLAVTLYLNGETDSWELIDALRTSVDAMIAAHYLDYTRMRAAIELRRVTGYPLLEN